MFLQFCHGFAWHYLLNINLLPLIINVKERIKIHISLWIGDIIHVANRQGQIDGNI